MYPYRKQLSLTIKDKELYENFILPAGQELPSIVLRCLAAYYRRDDIRSMIEGDEIAHKNPNTSMQNTIAEIKQTLAMQSFYAESLQDELENGIDDATSVLERANKRAEEDGFVKKETNEQTGAVTYRITDKLSQVTPAISEDFTELQTQILEAAKKGNFTEAFESNIKVQNELLSKVETLIMAITKGNSAELQTLLNATPSVENAESGATAPQPVEDEVVEEPKQDATKALDDLLGSLGEIQ